MHNRNDTRYLFLKRKVSTALLFVVAFLFLIVSCPLKKLLLKDVSSHFSALTGSNKTNINQSNTIHYAVANCPVAKDPFFTTDLQQEKIQAPVYLLNNPNATGFKINYFLNATNGNGHSLFASSATSSVPLFLQQLRLLI